MRTLGSVAVLVAVGMAQWPGVALAHGGSDVQPAAPVAVEQSDVDARFAVTVSEARTTYATDASHAGRAHNVELAASRLDGVVLQPGEELSFNQRVGERTLANGFRHAPELADGALQEGVGGGVCQVATTLHVAALTGGLEIVEHRTHSMPVPYVARGLDATVYWNRIDFRVRNPYAFAIRVRASAAAGVVAVTLEGAAPVVAARITTTVMRTLPQATQEIPDATLAAGARVVSHRGRDGIVIIVRAVRGEQTVTYEWTMYPASDRIVRVGGA